MKHELRALFRVLLYLGVVVLVLACVARLLLLADPEGFFGIMLGGIAIYMSVIVCFAAFITSITQFSRSFFTGEGYMTFSLPATPSQLIGAKLLSAIIASLFGVVVAILASAIFMLGLGGDVWAEISSAFGELGGMINSYFSSDPLLAVELILIVLSGIPMTLLFVYLIISVGQLFTKARKGITFGIAIGAIVVLSILQQYCCTPILNAAETVSPHLSAWIEIVVNVALDVGMFFLIRYILTHKVNLIV